MYILTGDNRVIKLGGGKIEEFADGVWGPVRSTLPLGNLMDDEARELTEHEVARIEKNGKL